MTTSTLPTIWDRLADAGLSGRLYHEDLPFLLLWGQKYVDRFRPFEAFLADAEAGNLPNVSFVDPAFGGEGQGVSRDDHPHADVRGGESFISQVYEAVRNSPNWGRTVMLINYDEWGGFYDHVTPPHVVDDTPYTTAGPDWTQLGFRVPNVVVSPYAPKGRIISGGAPFDHTSALKMIEWRWGLAPLTARDANARNLAEYLDFDMPKRHDKPKIPQPLPSEQFTDSTPCVPPSA